jgi:hypothetical protein
MFLKFEKVLKNPRNLKNHLNLMFLMYHLFPKSDSILKNLQNLNFLKNLTYR